MSENSELKEPLTSIELDIPYCYPIEKPTKYEIYRDYGTDLARQLTSVRFYLENDEIWVEVLRKGRDGNSPLMQNLQKDEKLWTDFLRQGGPLNIFATIHFKFNISQSEIYKDKVKWSDFEELAEKILSEKDTLYTDTMPRAEFMPMRRSAIVINNTAYQICVIAPRSEIANYGIFKLNLTMYDIAKPFIFFNMGTYELEALRNAPGSILIKDNESALEKHENIKYYRPE